MTRLIVYMTPGLVLFILGGIALEFAGRELPDKSGGHSPEVARLYFLGVMALFLAPSLIVLGVVAFSRSRLLIIHLAPDLTLLLTSIACVVFTEPMLSGPAYSLPWIPVIANRYGELGLVIFPIIPVIKAILYVRRRRRSVVRSG